MLGKDLDSILGWVTYRSELFSIDLAAIEKKGCNGVSSSSCLVSCGRHIQEVLCIKYTIKHQGTLSVCKCSCS